MRPRDFARKLRDEMTVAEKALWQRIRLWQLDGCKFRRQAPIGPFIVDFVCYERKLVIELDGGQHAEPATRRKDDERTLWLNSQGFRVLRFWDHDVLTDMDTVLEAIWLALRPPHPGPPPQGGREDVEDGPFL